MSYCNCCSRNYNNTDQQNNSSRACSAIEPTFASMYFVYWIMFVLIDAFLIIVFSQPGYTSIGVRGTISCVLCRVKVRERLAAQSRTEFSRRFLISQ